MREFGVIKYGAPAAPAVETESDDLEEIVVDEIDTEPYSPEAVEAGNERRTWRYSILKGNRFKCCVVFLIIFVIIGALYLERSCVPGACTILLRNLLIYFKRWPFHHQEFHHNFLPFLH